MGRHILPGGPPDALTAQRADIVVFACGNPAHGEHDSVAIAACTSLPAAVLERIDLKLVGPMRPEYLRDLAQGTYVVIADTVPGTPGRIEETRFGDLVGREAPLEASSSTIQPLDEVIAMAQLVRSEPHPWPVPGAGRRGRGPHGAARCHGRGADAVGGGEGDRRADGAGVATLRRPTRRLAITRKVGCLDRPDDGGPDDR